MADVKWIKITTDMFENRKIKHIRRLSKGNNIVLIWIMLLTIAGKCNANGKIFLTENIPYTTKMLADELGFDENTVIIAIRTLTDLNMIVENNGFLVIAGWEEHQNSGKLAEIREYNRLAKQKQRKKQCQTQDVNDKSMTSQQCQDTDIDIEEDIDIESNNKLLDITQKSNKHAYGEYKNVFLTDEEFEKLKAEFVDYEERIERLSEYIASTGKSYKSHLATIRAWARKDKPKQQQSTGDSFMETLKKLNEERNNGIV